MASIQTTDEIRDILTRLEGQEIAGLQVLGINSLKSLSPMPDALVGEVIAGSSVDGRTFTIRTSKFEAAIDLQRTGRLVWLSAPEPYAPTAGLARPTARLLLAGGSGMDLMEPAKTKRITVTLSEL
jgi:hypothetical protein